MASLPVSFSWTAVDGAVQYNVDRSTTSAFTAWWYQYTSGTETSLSVGTLESSTTYYWRAVARNDYAWGRSSETWSCTTLSLPLPTDLISPANGSLLPGLGTSLGWVLPPGTTQYHLQVTPFNNDGPGINLIRNTETSFIILPPVFGQGNYVMLPGMTYSWRVRATSKATFAPEDDPSWGPWSAQWTFRTPAPFSTTTSPVFPANGAIVASVMPLALQWSNTATDIFYYEVQASPDPNFGAQGAVAAVWHNLVHGGVTNPLNSWLTSQLQPNTTYYWRVRPRVQGDGTPVAWSPTWSFRTP